MWISRKLFRPVALTMGVADGRVEADGEEIYQVKGMRVALSET